MTDLEKMTVAAVCYMRIAAVVKDGHPAPSAELSLLTVLDHSGVRTNQIRVAKVLAEINKGVSCEEDHSVRV